MMLFLSIQLSSGLLPQRMVPRTSIIASATATTGDPATDFARGLTSNTAVTGISEPEGWRWISGCGRPVPQFASVLEEIRRTQLSRDNVEVHVGCDSAINSGQRVCFATVICIISRSGGGGRYFYARSVEPERHYPVLQTRLLREVELSLSVAELLMAHDVEVTTVHCDSNTDPRYKSTEHTNMLTGYIQSMGFEYLVKPHAWATFVADRHSRGLMSLRGSQKRKALA